MEGNDMVMKLQTRYPKAADGISLARCHHCGAIRQVFGCFPSSNCEPKYCEHCLKTQYHEDIVAKLNDLITWACPFKQGKCTCPSCGVRNLKVYCSDRSDDIIQSALDHNAHLMLHLNSNQGNLTRAEQEICLKVVFENLKKLAKLADFHKKEEKSRA